MRHKRVRAGRLYRYVPVALDRFDPKSGATEGQRVRVVVLRGAPSPNTWGHAHVEDEAGNFLGLVCCNSLNDT